jgi:hypothetical protein
MDVVRVKEEKTCTLCLKPIMEGEECLMFRNSLHEIPEEIKMGYLAGNRFMIHFRHIECQWNKTGKKRYSTLESYVQVIKAELEQKKNNHDSAR